MSFYFPNTDPAYIYKRAGTTNDPYLFLHQTAQVVNGVVVLKEIPEYASKVIVKKLDGTTLTEVTTTSLSTNQYRVDYSTGIVYFPSSLETNTLTFDYNGTGYVSFPASRIWVDENKSIQQLFNDMNSIKTRWLTAVNSYSNIATTYPTPLSGDTVQTISDNKIYRYDGNAWVFTQQYSASALTDVQNKVGDVSTLQTTSKILVGAINENKATSSDNNQRIKNLYLDVKKDFGAKGTDTTNTTQDDTTSLQNAFNYARDNGSVNLYFPEGIYCISNYIQVYKNTTVKFHPNAVVKRIGTYYKMFANGTIGNSSYVVNSGYTGDGNIHFIGGTFDLNCQTGSTSPLADTQTVTFFDLGHAENISFHKITVKNGQIGHYFQLSSVKNVKIKECWFGSARYSLPLPTDGSNPNYNFECIQIEIATPASFPSFGNYDNSISRDIWIEDCIFDNVIRAVGTHSFIPVQTTTGSISSGSASLTVADVTKFSVGESILVSGAAESNGNLSTTISSISGSILTLANNASTTVSNASISNKTDMNIPALFCENINIINNTFYNSVDNSINLTGFRYSSVKNNKVIGSGAYGINLSQTEDSEIMGNTIINPYKAAVNTKYAHRNKFSNIIKDPCLSTLNSYSANRLDNSNDNTFNNDTVYSLNPNFTYAWYSTSSTGNKIISHNYAKGKTNTFGGDNFSLSANKIWCSVGDSITRGNNSGNGYFQDHALPILPKVNTLYNRGYGGYCAYIPPTITTGSISNGSTTLTVADSTSFSVGGNINVVGAGADGLNLKTTVSAKNGNTLTLAVAASATVSNAVVRSVLYDSIRDVINLVEVADVYTVFLGTNDFSRNVPIGTSADATGLTNSFWGGLKQLYADLTAKNMNAIIVFITPLKRTSSPAWDSANTAGVKLADYVQAIKDFASTNGCPVLDLFNESGVSNTTAASFLYDGLHPNIETNKRIGRMIGNKINQYI